MMLLFSLMSSGIKRDPKIKHTIDNFCSNQIKIVTFNYDRSFEFALYQYVKHKYDFEPQQLLECVQAIPVHHVYGQLGELPEFKPGVGIALRCGSHAYKEYFYSCIRQY